MLLIHHDKGYLKSCLAEIRGLVEGKLELRLNPKTQIFPIKNGVDFLGFHAYLTETGKVVLKIRKESAKRMKRKLKVFEEKYKSEKLDMKEIEQCLYGWFGHVEFGSHMVCGKSCSTDLS